MFQRSLFSRPRLKLAGTYAGVMGLLLTLLGGALHEAIATSSDEIIQRELKTLGAVFQGALTPLLLQPGQLDPAVTQSFPELCFATMPCLESSNAETAPQPDGHATVALSSLRQEGYQLRLLDLAGAPIATLGPDDPRFATLSPDLTWQLTQEPWGDRHRIYTIPLTTQVSGTAQPWGHLQIGCSYQALEKYMQLLHLLLLVGLPLGIGSIALTAWWLSGMAMRPIAESYARIEQFSADVAHELRTPLSAMRATAEAEITAIQYPQPTNRAEPSTIHILHRQILRLSQMVQDLLLLSRLENHPVEDIQPVNLNEILEDLEEEFTPLIFQSNVHFMLELNQEELWVNGNLDALYRLFINLISNAIHHTSEKGLVVVKSSCSDSNIYIEIQDSGPGISPDLQQHIFKRFYRINHDRSRTTGGTGLGLAIAKAIAKQHKGDIKLVHPAAQGACFQAVLPRLKNHY